MTVPRDDRTGADSTATDEAVAERIKQAGAILIGKTNVPPLVGDYQTNNPIFGRTNNPWHLDRTPGGSSGGAAAAVAAGLSALDIGSDLGGSIRVPASYTGLYGFKPSDRRVSLRGHIPPPPGVPQVIREGVASAGPLARSAEDLILAARVLFGSDPLDPISVPLPFRDHAPVVLGELRIALAPTFPGVPIAAETSSSIEELGSRLARAGAEVTTAFPAFDHDEYTALADALFPLLETTFPHPPASGEPNLLADYFTTFAERDGFVQRWDEFFGEWDVLLLPAVAGVAFTHREPFTSTLTIDGAEVGYLEANHPSIAFNLAGSPAAVLPLGRDADGLPFGVQVVGRRFEDERLLRAVEAIDSHLEGFVPPPGY